MRSFGFQIKARKFGKAGINNNETESNLLMFGVHMIAYFMSVNERTPAKLQQNNNNTQVRLPLNFRHHTCSQLMSGQMSVNIRAFFEVRINDHIWENGALTQVERVHLAAASRQLLSAMSYTV